MKLPGDAKGGDDGSCSGVAEIIGLSGRLES